MLLSVWNKHGCADVKRGGCVGVSPLRPLFAQNKNKSKFFQFCHSARPAAGSRLRFNATLYKYMRGFGGGQRKWDTGMGREVIDACFAWW